MYNQNRKNDFLQTLINQPKEKTFNLEVNCIENGWGEMCFNHGVNSDTINLFGKECSYGLGCHCPSKIEINLNGECDRLTGFVGQECNYFTKTLMVKFMNYSIIGDGKELWKGTEEVDFHSIDISVKNVQKIILTAEVDDTNYAHVVWGDLTLYSGNKKIMVGKDIVENKPAFSFKYNGVSSDKFIYSWDYKCEKGSCEDGDTYKVTYSKDNLDLIIDVIDYKDCAALWWDVYFENNSSEKSGQISDVMVLDYYFDKFENPVLHTAYGSACQIDDFKPIKENLKFDTTFNTWTNGGRSTNYHIPYFNINGENNSIVGALGWSGQWRGYYTNKGNSFVNCKMGLDNYVDFYVKPGEKLQMPSMCLVFSQGEFEENQNDFRKYCVKYIIPKDKTSTDPKFNCYGKQIKPAPICVMGWGGMKTEEYEKRIEAIEKYKLPYEYYWVDAGWYGPESSYSPDEHKGDWAIHVGNWQVNPKAHPKGLRYLSDRFNEIGLKFLLWVEIERAIYGTPVYNEHPDFWVGKKGKNENQQLDMSNDAACDWVIEFISDLIEKYNIKCFREDYNFDPIISWQKTDEENRHGITEIKAINNSYRFWKTLLNKYDDLIIDNCASGGRRLDINMAKLSYSLWRTDYECDFNFDPIGAQLAQCWFGSWNINHSTGTQEFPLDTFRMRSCFATGYCMHFSSYEARPVKDDYPYDWHRKMLEEYHSVRPYFYGNYYSLIEAKLDRTAWIAYEMFREDLGEGCILIFREENSCYKSTDILLKGLKENCNYIIEDLDKNSTFEMSGKDLMEKGFEVIMPNKRESKLLIIKKI